MYSYLTLFHRSLLSIVLRTEFRPSLVRIRLLYFLLQTYSRSVLYGLCCASSFNHHSPVLSDY